MGDKLAPNERHSYVHNGQVVYEWDQTLSEVNVYFQVPAGVTAKLIYCEISRKHLRLGIKPNPPYLDLDLFSTVQVDDSFWTLGNLPTLPLWFHLNSCRFLGSTNLLLSSSSPQCLEPSLLCRLTAFISKQALAYRTLKHYLNFLKTTSWFV